MQKIYRPTMTRMSLFQIPRQHTQTYATRNINIDNNLHKTTVRDVLRKFENKLGITDESTLEERSRILPCPRGAG